MKIYGKNLPEVLAEMPWQLKIIVMVGTIWIPFALIHAGYIFLTVGRYVSRPGVVNFTGNPINMSVADPSLAPSNDGRNGAYMAFTIVMKYHDRHGPDATRWAPGIRLAESHTPCKNWSDVGMIATSTQEEIIGPDSVNLLAPIGSWWLEQPALVYDPTDPDPEKAYKVWYYRYLWLGPEENNMQISRLYGMIAYKYTGMPSLNKWSTEQWVFGAKTKTSDNSMDGRPPDPYGGLVQYHINDFDKSLQDVYFYARPSVAVFNDKLYMTLSGFPQTGVTPDRIILLVSGDHAKTWHYVATLLHAADVGKLGPYTRLYGATLIEKDGKLYLSAVLGDDKVLGLGSFMMPFEDPDKGALVLDKKTGNPVIAKHIPRVSVQPTIIGGGFSAYIDRCKGTYESEYSGLKKNIHIFQTQKDPVKPD
jgi:hypothetical protein